MSLGGLENYLLPIIVTIGFVAVAISVFLATKNKKLFEDILRKPEKETKKVDPKVGEEKEK